MLTSENSFRPFILICFCTVIAKLARVDFRLAALVALSDITAFDKLKGFIYCRSELFPLLLIGLGVVPVKSDTGLALDNANAGFQPCGCVLSEGKDFYSVGIFADIHLVSPSGARLGWRWRARSRCYPPSSRT